MKCPVCGTNGVERGVCFYCAARKQRAEKKNTGPKAAGGEVPSPASQAPILMHESPEQPERPELLILGAGLAGLSAASRLQQNGWKVTVLEAAPHVGGLAASFHIETAFGSFTYDNGPHRFHTSDEHLIQEVKKLLGDNICQADRKSRIFLYNRFFDYPLKGGNVVRSLPPLVLLQAFAGYAWVRLKSLFSKVPDSNFENWVVNRFGRKLFDVFFGTYTEKTWGIPCSEISADWAAQRISLLSLWDTVKKTLFRPRNMPRTYISTFVYPRQGGIGELCRAYQDQLSKAGMPVQTSSPVCKVLLQDGRVCGVVVGGADGPRRLRTSRVLSTIPMTILAQLLDPPPPAPVLESLKALRHRSMIFVYLILDRPQLTSDHWIYLPEQSLITHRLSEFKNFSKAAAPSDKTLICAEITCNYRDQDWCKSDEELRDIVARDLVKIGLIKKSEILQTFSRRERHAYPLYDLTYRANRDRVLDYIGSIQGLDTTGRQGLFKYNNMDHSMAMGLFAADNLLGQGQDHKQVASGRQYFG